MKKFVLRAARWIRLYRLEVADFLCLEAALFFWQQWSRGHFASVVVERLLGGMMLLFFLAFLILFYLILRKWGKKVGQPLKELAERAVHRLFARVMDAVESFRVRLGRGYDHLTGGVTRITFDFSSGKKKPSRFRRVGWRQLETEREKLGRLYTEVVEDRLRAGARLSPSDTPGEIRDKTPEWSSEDEQILSLYARHRYDERISPPEGEGNRLRAARKKR